MQIFSKGLVQITDLLENPLCIMYYGGGCFQKNSWNHPPGTTPHNPLYKGGWC